MKTRSAPVSMLALAVGVITLAGCSLLPETVGPSGEPSTSPSSSSTPSPLPSDVPNTAGDFSAECDQVLSPQTVYDFNPNFALDIEFEPTAGSTAARLAELGAVVCAWRNLSSGDHIVVAIGEPAAEDAAAIEAEAAAVGSPTTEFAVPGYFSEVDGRGESLVISGSGVILVSSMWFTTPADAIPLVDAAVAAYAD